MGELYYKQILQPKPLVFAWQDATKLGIIGFPNKSKTQIPPWTPLSDSGIYWMLSDVFCSLKADFKGLFCEKHELIKPIS